MIRGTHIAEVIKHLGAKGLNNVNVAVSGIITSVDTNKYLAKVQIGISGVETGWLPIGTLLAGNGYGIIAIPEQGTEVTVVFDNGDLHNGKVILANFNGTDQPPSGMNPGEILVQAKSGAKIKLDKNGNISLNEGTAAVARVGDRVDMNPSSPTYGQIISGSSTVFS